jgi:hypothetical protein
MAGERFALETQELQFGPAASAAWSQPNAGSAEVTRRPNQGVAGGGVLNHTPRSMHVAVTRTCHCRMRLACKRSADS